MLYIALPHHVIIYMTLETLIFLKQLWQLSMVVKGPMHMTNQ